MENAILTMLGEDEKSIKIQFNPSDYSTSKSARYADEKPVSQGKRTSKQFIAEESETFKLKLTLDGFTKDPNNAKTPKDAALELLTLDPEEAEDIYERAAFFRKLTAIDEKLHKPPLCRFSWGSFTFTGYTESVNINYTMFASCGKPVRATVELSIKSSDNKKIPLQSPDRTKRKVLTEGTPLYLIAYEAYKDPAEWRRIAEANGIKNPRRLEAGVVLKIPPMEFE